ncbi:unnamed protein product [Orchesella dallaii]|uniref:Uncharacterized protein n=1 Tax=Orchesella dallaii TaxID=48710 RepID=A0ABP1R0H4_9HEXA
MSGISINSNLKQRKAISYQPDLRAHFYFHKQKCRWLTKTPFHNVFIATNFKTKTQNGTDQSSIFIGYSSSSVCSIKFITSNFKARCSRGIDSHGSHQFQRAIYYRS